MFNDNDDFYEVNDYDEDIRCKEALLEEAKALDPELEWNAVFRELSDLKRKWKRIPYWDSAYEDTLSEEFDTLLDVFYSKRREGFGSNQVVKEDLIKQAERISTSSDWREATDEMNRLMQEWKQCGSAGKEIDDALWETFNAARQKFFDRKNQYWEELKDKFGDAKKAKESIIEEAKTLVNADDWQATNIKFKQLMEQWKSVGSAGRDYEDHLWNEFNELRNQYYGRQSEYYEKMNESQDQRYAEKQTLVDEAKAIMAKNEYTKENTEQMKQLGVKWKQVGSCGKEKEDRIWQEFRTLMDAYFAGLKQKNEKKHTEWLHRMQENRSRKLDLIMKQKRQIRYLENEVVGLLGQKAIDDTLEEIEEIKEFIIELEEQLAELDARLKGQ